MPRPSSAPVDVHPNAALYILERLRKAGRLTLAEIRSYMSDMGREIRELEERLTTLRNAAPAAVTRSSRAPRSPQRADAKRQGAADATQAAAPAKRRKRTFTVTPAVLKSRELQGRYLPLLNRMPQGKRAYYAKLAKEKGREAAIQEMEAALRS
jgi:O6-methylguanine-DNA--protein-cysteine methyltransferase